MTEDKHRLYVSDEIASEIDVDQFYEDISDGDYAVSGLLTAR